MKKILFVAAIIFSSQLVKAQTLTPRGTSSVTEEDERLSAKSNFYVPSGRLPALNGGLSMHGGLYYGTDLGFLYTYNHTTTAWEYVLNKRMADSLYAPLALGTGYIQNGTTQQASSNFNISGNGTIGGVLSVGTPFSGAAISINKEYTDISGVQRELYVNSTLSNTSAALTIWSGYGNILTVLGTNTQGISNIFNNNNVLNLNSGATGSVAQWWGSRTQLANSSAMTVNNAYGFLFGGVSQAGSGVTGNAAGLALGEITATNKTYLLSGTTTIPSGNWGWYNATAHNSFTGTGNLQVGSATPTSATERLQVTGRASISQFLTGTAGTDSIVVHDNTTKALKLISPVIPIAAGGTGLTTLGTADQLLRVNSGATALEYFTPPYLTESNTATVTNKTIPAGSNTITGLTNANFSGSAGITDANISSAASWNAKGDALTTNPISQFASTSSAQLRGVLNDESGTGVAYFQGGSIGTPSAGVATNLTGLPLSTGVTGLLPIANGGTGSATQNFVDLSTTQAISGQKTFNTQPVFPNGVYASGTAQSVFNGSIKVASAPGGFILDNGGGSALWTLKSNTAANGSPFEIQYNGVLKSILTTTGKLGLGTSTPRGALDLDAGSGNGVIAGMTYPNTTGGYSQWDFYDKTAAKQRWAFGALAPNYTDGSISGNKFFIYQSVNTGGTTLNLYRFLINDLGNIQIGSNTATAGAPKLDVTGSIGSTALTASSLVSTDANKVLTSETGTGFLKLTSGAISYDNSTYLPLTGGTLTGDLTGTTANFSGNIAVSRLNVAFVGGVTIPSSGAVIYNKAANELSFMGQNGKALSFNTGSLSSGRILTAPDAAGTIALTSDLASYLPLAGGTLTGALTGTGASFTGLNITGTGGVGYINLASNNTSTIPTPTASINLFSQGYSLAFKNTAGFVTSFQSGALTGNQVVFLPNGSGEMVLNANTATITNKTMSGASNTFSNIPWSAITGAPAFAPLSGGTNYIQNSASVQTPASFNISGSGTLSSLQIGATAIPSGYVFASSGAMITKSIKVKDPVLGWPDYVFLPEYQLKPLREVEQFINTNKHLPGIPSAKEVSANGIDLGEMNARLLKKIEEMTLYMIDQEKKIQKLEQVATRTDELERKLNLLLKESNK